MKINKKFLLLGIIIVIVIILSACFYFKYIKVVNKDFKNINLKNINNLMIVAHPDDEMLWGGGALIKDNYLVVCVTCGNVKIRNYEFVNVMNETDDKYIMLGYPDLVAGKVSKWENDYKKIEKDLKDILNLKKWDLVVTHNPHGEYGHPSHINVNKIITNNFEDKDKLYYFGKFYHRDIIRNYIEDMTPLNSNILKEKNRILGNYGSQLFYQFSYDHMIPYENWVKYKDWR